LVLDSSASVWEGFATLTDNGDFAYDRFFADLDTEILHWLMTASRRTTEAPHRR